MYGSTSEGNVKLGAKKTPATPASNDCKSASVVHLGFACDVRLHHMRLGVGWRPYHASLVGASSGRAMHKRILELAG